jgi:transcriptional regulator with XRE-family HTH domain
MIFPFQIRAARVMAGLSQQELATRSGVGLATLKRIEAGGTKLTGTVRIVTRLKRTLEEAGVVFIEQDRTSGPGVRLRNPLP